MSEISTEATSEQAEGQAPEDAATEKETRQPKIEGEYDPERAARLIGKLRAEIEDLKPLATKAKELEDAQKSEQQRLIERAEAAEAERKRLEGHLTRLKVAAKAGIPEELADLLGEGPEETLEARAKALTEWRGNTSAPVPGKPVEATRSTVLAADDNAANPNDWLRKRIAERGQ